MQQIFNLTGSDQSNFIFFFFFFYLINKCNKKQVITLFSMEAVKKEDSTLSILRCLWKDKKWIF